MDPDLEVIPKREKESCAAGLAAVPEWIHVPVVLLVWAVWWPLRFLTRLFKGTWRILWASRVRRLVSLGLLAIVILGMVKAVPLIYGRFALLYEAAYLARTSLGRDAAEIRGTMTQTAFRHGYSDAIEQGEAFGIETAYDDNGLLLCSISIDLQQRVSCYGLCKVQVTIRTRISRPVDPEVVRSERWE